MRLRFRTAAVVLFGMLSLASLLSVGACGDDDRTPAHAAVGDGAIDRVHATPTPGPAPSMPEAAPPPPIVFDGGSCTPLVEAPTIVPATHLPEGTAIAYSSNPPSSGPHYPVWANFQEYATPVPDGYLVHSMEHGAVVLLYRCDALDAGAGTCPEVVAALRSVRDALATDASCDPTIRVRIILAPRPELDVPVAAAAWGFTYK